jgi:hypothetical protein
MGWISERWNALKRAAGHRRYVIGGIITLALAGFDIVRSMLGGIPSMTALVGLPSWVVALLVFLCLVIYWLLERLVYLEHRINIARADLARLRTKGVEIRNRGIREIDTEQKWDAWRNEASNWNNDVIEALRKNNEADAEWFSVLDIVPNPRIAIEALPPQQAATDFVKLYREHDLRVKRLGEMVYELWRD